MATIYVTTAGRTSAKTDIFGPAIRQFSPDRLVILTSESIEDAVRFSVKKHHVDTPYDVVLYDDPPFSMNDYIPTLYDLFKKVSDVFLKDPDSKNFQVVVNLSGGPTKCMALMSDLATMFSLVFPQTRLVFGCYDTLGGKVVFKDKPMLSKDLLLGLAKTSGLSLSVFADDKGEAVDGNTGNDTGPSSGDIGPDDTGDGGDKGPTEEIKE